MSIDLRGVSGPAQPGLANVQDGPDGAAGTLLGRAATVVDSPLSLLADAAEELTFAADTTDDFELSERKERKSTEDAMAERIELYKELMHQAGKGEGLDRLKDSLKSQQGREEARREALSHFPDPSDAWAALHDALQAFEDDPAIPDGVREAVRGAIADLEAEHGPAIRAGVHGALASAGFADLGDADALRDLYRGTVCDFTTVEQVFATINERYGDERFDVAIGFLYRALSSDLGSDMPSMDGTHLESVNTSLGQLRLLKSAHALCADVMTRWENVHGVKDCPLTAQGLLEQVVALRSENFLGALHIDRIAAQAKAPDIEHEVLFLQELLRMTRNVPAQLFDGTAGRMKLLDAVQDAVDRAIDREDAFLAAQEG